MSNIVRFGIIVNSAIEKKEIQITSLLEIYITPFAIQFFVITADIHFGIFENTVGTAESVINFDHGITVTFFNKHSELVI